MSKVRRRIASDRLLIWTGVWLVACCVCFALSGSHLLDEWDADRAQVDPARTERQIEQAKLAYIARQQQACGPNAGERLRKDGSTVCTDKHGRVTCPAVTGGRP